MAAAKQHSRDNSSNSALRFCLQAGLLVHSLALITGLTALTLFSRGYSVAAQQQHLRSVLDQRMNSHDLGTLSGVLDVYDPDTKSNQSTLQLLALVESNRYDQALSLVRSHRVHIPKADPQALTPVADALSRANETSPSEADKESLAQLIRELLYAQNISPTPTLVATVYTRLTTQLAKYRITLPQLLA